MREFDDRTLILSFWEAVSCASSFDVVIHFQSDITPVEVKLIACDKEQRNMLVRQLPTPLGIIETAMLRSSDTACITIPF